MQEINWSARRGQPWNLSPWARRQGSGVRAFIYEADRILRPVMNVHGEIVTPTRRVKGQPIRNTSDYSKATAIRVVSDHGACVLDPLEWVASPDKAGEWTIRRDLNLITGCADEQQLKAWAAELISLAKWVLQLKSGEELDRVYK